jgi:integrase
MTRVQTAQRAFGNVRKLPSGRFQARWEGPDGYSHKAPETFATRDEAKLWLAGERLRVAGGTHVDRRSSGETLGDYVAAGWRDRAFRHLRPSSRARDLGYLDRYVLPRWGPVAWHDVSTDDVQEWANDLLELEDAGAEGEGLAARTVRDAVRILRKLLAAGVKANPRRIAENPAEGVKLAKAGRRAFVHLGPAEIAALASAIDDAGAGTGKGWRRGRHAVSYAPLILTACYCGLRIGELAALRVRDIDLERRQITVMRAVTEVEGIQHLGQTKTAAGRRVVPIPAIVAPVLADHLADRHPDDLAFPSSSGDYLRVSGFRSRRFAPAVRRALGGRAMRIHDMRHTAISLWVEAGIDPVQIAAWAGHTSVVTVLDVYGHLRPRPDDPMRALDALVAAETGPGATITRLHA